jgi:uncharacterized membrane protein YcaP (DUF421 family)
MDKIVVFWNGWEPLMRILIVGTLIYISVISILRVSGKRTLASMNAFDFIITVALGSTFGRVLTAKQVAVSEAIVSFLLLISLQYVVSYLEVRSPFFHKLVTSQPRLLYYKGNFIDKNLRKERLLEEDLVGAVRKKKFASLDDVEAIVLETDGQFSVIKKSSNTQSSTIHELAASEK